jgi:Zn-dependent M28 family amino/carboxypeptidase
MIQRFFFFLVCLTPVAQVYTQNISADSLKKHVFYLASDKLGGRAPGSKGEKLAQRYIQQAYSQIGLIPKGTQGYLQPFQYKRNLNPHDTTGKKSIACKGSNILGFIDNQATYTIVIGAHYDHLGHGESGSPLEKGKKKKIFNGADDNASGVAGVIELARYFAGNNQQEKHNFLFMCFSAEEDGLIGSKYFTNYPTLELLNVNVMLNMDMIGRLNDSTRALMVYGVGTSPGFPDFVRNHAGNLKLVLDSAGAGPSDHASFYRKNIPVLHFFTGQHSDYHKSTDDADKCNYSGSAEVLDFIIRLTENISGDAKLAFTPTVQKETARGGFKVSMGIMPDYSYEGKGLRIDGVTEGKPAQRAGIKANDVLIELNGKAVQNIRDYMGMLSQFNKGDKVPVKVQRNQEIVELEVVF